MDEKIERQVNELRSRVNPPDLVINRVPKKELQWFKNWCKEEFENDWGMGLKFLCLGYMLPEDVVLFDEIEKLRERIERLESRTVEDKVRTTGSGKRIGGKNG